MSYIFKERIKEIVNGLIEGTIVVDVKGVSKNYTANVAEACAVFLETGEFPACVSSKVFTSNLEQTVKELIESGEIVLPSKGTPVEIGGSYEKLYFNRSMSDDEIYSLVTSGNIGKYFEDQLTTTSQYTGYYLLEGTELNGSNNRSLNIGRNRTGGITIDFSVFEGSRGNTIVIYANEQAYNDGEASFVGWDPSISSDEYTVNIKGNDYGSYGEYNEELSSLISTTPFE